GQEHAGAEGLHHGPAGRAGRGVASTSLGPPNFPPATCNLLSHMRQKVDLPCLDGLDQAWPMQPRTEEFLNLLLWSAEKLMRPTFRNLTDSYEGWAYRSGLNRQVASLERQRLLERDNSRPNDRLYRLSWQGRLHALGGRDPEARWSREWDGRWRLVLFDVPTSQNTHRARLRRYLRDKGFGYLQNSVWIT